MGGGNSPNAFAHPIHRLEWIGSEPVCIYVLLQLIHGLHRRQLDLVILDPGGITSHFRQYVRGLDVFIVKII